MGKMLNSDSLRNLSHDEFLVDLEDGIRGFPSRERREPGCMLPRKEVIQPHLPVRLPCYDFTPITDPTLDACLPQGVSLAASGVADFRGVTGGVYKTRERIHRGVLTHGY